MVELVDEKHIPNSMKANWKVMADAYLKSINWARSRNTSFDAGMKIEAQYPKLYLLKGHESSFTGYDHGNYTVFGEGHVMWDGRMAHKKRLVIGAHEALHVYNTGLNKAAGLFQLAQLMWGGHDPNFNALEAAMLKDLFGFSAEYSPLYVYAKIKDESGMLITDHDEDDYLKWAAAHGLSGTSPEDDGANDINEAINRYFNKEEVTA